MLEVSIVEVTANHNNRIEKDCWKEINKKNKEKCSNLIKVKMFN